MADVGNPNFFKLFKGKYFATDTLGNQFPVMLTATNDIIFMNNFTSDANKLLCTIPPEIRPLNTITICAWCSGVGVNYIDIRADGQVRAQTASKLYYMNGLTVNISDRYYA